MSDELKKQDDAGTDAPKSEELGNYLHLSEENSLSLEGLTDEQAGELRKKHIESMIGLKEKHAASMIEGKAIDQRMTDITDNVAKATADQSAATITGSYDDKLGRTEVIIGNTETAQKGKLSKSQRGEKDNTLIIVLVVVGAIILLALILSR